MNRSTYIKDRCGFTEEGKAGTLFEGVILICTLPPHKEDVPHEDENLFKSIPEDKES